jgi:starch-binding outer membrane protein, SusD/RagB family
MYKNIITQSINPKIRTELFITFILVITFTMSCKKLVDIGPPVAYIVASEAYSNSTSANAVLTGMYGNMFGNNLFQGIPGMSMGLGLSADELTQYNTGGQLVEQLYTNSVLPTNVPYWSSCYQFIYEANAAIEGIESSTGISPSLKVQMVGEAKFVRAVLYFYAVNLFGDVPLITSSNYVSNASIARTAQSVVLQQIITDLITAQNSLSPNFLDQTDSVVTEERVRPTKWAASALLARVYLYSQKWDSAVAQATLVISNSTQFSLCSDLNNVFLANSTEAIWQLESNVGSQGFATSDGYNFILINTPANDYNTPTAISDTLLSAFEPGDLRKTNWINAFTADSVTFYYYPYKYKQKGGDGNSITPTENLMLLRLGELYLIRAEAEAELNDITDATADLNVIRTRAGLVPKIQASQSDLLASIMHERQVELFTELGHRWFDLKRTGAIDFVMSGITSLKGGQWDPYKKLFPIPISDIQADPALIQNSGY